MEMLNDDIVDRVEAAKLALQERISEVLVDPL